MDIPEPIGDELRARLSRIEGQVRGIARMVEEGRDCRDVVTQLQAATRALERARVKLLVSGLRHCALLPDGEQQSSEFEQLLLRSG